MLGNGGLKLHNRRLDETLEHLVYFTDGPVSIDIMTGLNDYGHFDRYSEAGPQTIAGAACVEALNHLLYAPMGSFVQSVLDHSEPTKQSEKAASKAIKKIFKAWDAHDGARASVFMALSAVSSARSMVATDPDNATNGEWFEELYEWIEDYVAPRFLYDGDRDLLLAMNVTRNDDFLAWDMECAENGATPPTDPLFITFHNAVGSLLAMGLGMATNFDIVRNTYACSELEGLSQEAIERSDSLRWAEFRTFLIPIHWRNALSAINDLVLTRVKTD